MGEHTINIDEKNFNGKVTESNRPVIIDFWAEWCMPCKMIAPAVEDIAGEYKGRIDVGKINVDENPGLATRLSVMNIPTLIFFKSGKELGRLVGLNTKEKIESKINEVFGG